MEIDINALKDSNEFLNTLLRNIDTAVFIADENLQIQQFNDSFLTLFSGQVPDNSNGGSHGEPVNHPALKEISFGNAAGCINAIQEKKTCGKTSGCRNCSLKRSLITTLKNQESAAKQSLERIFYINGKPVKKYLEFSSRPIFFHHQKMILCFVYDITRIKLSKLALEEKQRQIDMDLKKAGEIQNSLLPKHLPDMDSIRVDWFFEPSLMVGGDIFHIHREDDSHINAYMLDVCGHGVSAALIAVTAKQFLDQLHAQGLARNQFFTPAQVLNALEQEFPFERFDCYFTIVYTRLNIVTGRLIYGCAGHVPPVIVGDNNKFEVLDRHGIIIGLGSDSPFEEYETTLSRGDKLILYTDGLIDYFGDKGGASNKDHFYTSLITHSTKPPNQLVDEIMNRQQQLRNREIADDDISLLVIEYR